MDFAGSKIALLHDAGVLVYKRDTRSDIPFPGCWDLPGGGREGDETPHQCLVREVYEEFSILIDPRSITWEKAHPSAVKPGLLNYFFVAPISKTAIDSIVFGDEGERWQMMTVTEFIEHPEGVRTLQDQLRCYLDASKT